MIAGFLDAQFELRFPVVTTGNGVGVRFRGYPFFMNDKIDKPAWPEVHSCLHRGKGEFEVITDLLDTGDGIIKAGAQKPIEKPNINKAGKSKQEETPHRT